MEKSFISWFMAVLLQLSGPASTPPPGVEVLRSDVGHLAVDHSNWGTPLRVGGVTYDHGLGTHCNSAIAVRLALPGTSFDALVGLDDDPTALGRGGVLQCRDCG